MKKYFVVFAMLMTTIVFLSEPCHAYIVCTIANCKTCHMNEIDEICDLCETGYKLRGNACIEDINTELCQTDAGPVQASWACTDVTKYGEYCVQCCPSNCIECDTGYKVEDGKCVPRSGGEVDTTAGVTYLIRSTVQCE